MDYLSLTGFPDKKWKHQRILAFLSSNSAAPAAGVTSCDSPQCTAGWGGQDLQSTKPAGRNSCWNSQNSVFFPDIQHPLCFQWELLSLVLIACSPQPSPHPCFSDFTVPPLLSSLPCSSLPPFSRFRFSSTWAFLPSRSTAASSAQLLLKFLSLL